MNSRIYVLGIFGIGLVAGSLFAQQGNNHQQTAPAVAERQRGARSEYAASLIECRDAMIENHLLNSDNALSWKHGGKGAYAVGAGCNAVVVTKAGIFGTDYPCYTKDQYTTGVQFTMPPARVVVPGQTYDPPLKLVSAREGHSRGMVIRPFYDDELPLREGYPTVELTPLDKISESNAPVAQSAPEMYLYDAFTDFTNNIVLSYLLGYPDKKRAREQLLEWGYPDKIKEKLLPKLEPCAKVELKSVGASLVEGLEKSFSESASLLGDDFDFVP